MPREHCAHGLDQRRIVRQGHSGRVPLDGDLEIELPVPELPHPGLRLLREARDQRVRILSGQETRIELDGNRGLQALQHVEAPDRAGRVEPRIAAARQRPLPQLLQRGRGGERAPEVRQRWTRRKERRRGRLGATLLARRGDFQDAARRHHVGARAAARGEHRPTRRLDPFERLEAGIVSQVRRRAVHRLSRELELLDPRPFTVHRPGLPVPDGAADDGVSLVRGDDVKLARLTAQDLRR